ncbi:cupin domain-containing protein [Henriciella sp.]|uniref:cupin domain-containing protein n=1 Tax=Henriciella sp. TaxID=1968823 RepID=UPI0025C3CC8F|nr:cupin domain-containing protein [Henriciella sp.]
MSHADTYHAFMLDYATGNLSASMSLAATLHRLMSEEGDATARVWEAVRANIKAAGDDHKDAIDRMEDIATEIINTDYDDVMWRKGLSGARFSKLPENSGSLMRLEPGDRVFAHGHSTLEAMIVLEGALEDGRGTFGAGDLVLATPGERHRPAAAGNKPCTCFVARADTPFWRFT